MNNQEGLGQSKIVEAVGSIVSMIADAKDVFPDAEATLAAVEESVNELYGCLVDGVFNPPREQEQGR